MRSRVRPILILLLTVGLLAFSFRNANLRGVWAETRRADALPLLLALVVDARHVCAPGLSLAIPAGAPRPHPVQRRLPRHRDRIRGQFPAAGAGRRSDSAVRSGPARAAQRAGGVRDHHPRAPARPAGRAAAVRAVRADGRPGPARRQPDRARPDQDRRRDGRGRRARRGGVLLRHGRPPRPTGAAGPQARSNPAGDGCRRRWRASSRPSPKVWP